MVSAATSYPHKATPSGGKDSAPVFCQQDGGVVMKLYWTWLLLMGVVAAMTTFLLTLAVIWWVSGL